MALVQSLVRHDVVDDRVGEYGHLVVDECHHVSARSFELVVRRAKARFVAGLSATVARKDGHHPIVLMECGPVRYRVDPLRQAAARPFAHRAVVRLTGFRSVSALDDDVRKAFGNLYMELSRDERRNRLICEDVLTCLREGRNPLVLTERTEHLEVLEQLLAATVPNLICLRGGLKKKQLEALQERLANVPAREGRVVLATGGYIGEG